MRTNPISVFTLVTKIRNGHLILCAIIVRKCFVTRLKGNERVCPLGFPWYGENWRTTVVTATSLLLTQRGLERKIGIWSRIPVFLPQYDLCHTLMNFLFQFLTVSLHQKIRTVKKNSLVSGAVKKIIRKRRKTPHLTLSSHQPLSSSINQNWMIYSVLWEYQKQQLSY